MLNQKFKRGDKLPNSGYFNAITAAANAVERLSMRRGGFAELVDDSANVRVQVVNKTGNFLPPFSVVEINRGYGVSGTDERADFAYVLTNNAVLGGVVPSGNRDAVIAIFDADCSANVLKTATVLGVTACRVRVNDTGHKFAVPIAGNETMLDSSADGSIKILSELKNTGEQVCYVLLGSTGAGTAAPSETFTIAYPPLYGFIGDPALYNGKNDDNEEDEDDVLKYETLANNVSSFNFTKLGLAHKTGETLKPIPVMRFVEQTELSYTNNKGKRHYFGEQDTLNELKDVNEDCTALAYTGTLTNITGVFTGVWKIDDDTDTGAWEWTSLSASNGDLWAITYTVGESVKGMVFVIYDDAAHAESGHAAFRIVSRIKQKENAASEPLYYAEPTIDILNGFYQYQEGACGEWDHCYKTDVSESDTGLENTDKRVAFLYKLLEQIGCETTPEAGLAKVDYSDCVPTTTNKDAAMQAPLYLVATRGAVGGCLPKDTVIDTKNFKEYEAEFRLESLGEYPDIANVTTKGDELEERDDTVVSYKLLIADKKEAGAAVNKIWFEGEVPEDAFYLLKVKADFTEFADADGNNTTIEAIPVDLNEADHIKWWYEGQTYDAESNKVDYYYFRWVRYNMVNGVPDMDDTTACSYDCMKFAAAFARKGGYLFVVFMEQLPSMTYYPLKDQKCWYMVNDAECSPHARPKYSNKEGADADNGMWYFDEKIENVWAAFSPCREVAG